MTTTPISTQDIARFMQARGVARACPVCGGMNFALWDEVAKNSRAILTSPKLPGYDIIGADVMELVIAGCESCGVVRLHNRQTVVDWLAANPTP